MIVSFFYSYIIELMTLKEWLNQQIKAEYMKDILDQVSKDEAFFKVYPPKEQRYLSIELLPYDQLKVVIIGQDPYHQPGQANGLAFSCQKHPLPPSLKNIFRAIEYNGFDVNHDDGDLTRYVLQGVLLWNTYLSVIEGKPLSHKSDAYVTLTKHLIKKIVNEKEHIVFLLWGSFAQQFESLIDQRHLIIKTSHPSPLSSYRGFLTSHQFKDTNAYLISHGITPIDWR
jgi:uracil-DNA glycosylase